jgi:phenylalanyl-tRNA synthetase alpha chain
MGEKQLVPEMDFQVLTQLQKTEEPISIPDLAEKAGVDQSKASAVCLYRADLGEIEVQENVESEWKLGKKAKALPGKSLPERDIIEALNKMGGNAEIPQVAETTGLENKVIGQSLRWLEQKKWAQKDGKTLKILPDGQNALSNQYDDEKLIKYLMEHASATNSDLQTQGIDIKTACDLLNGRNFIEEKTRKTRMVCLTPKGRELVDQGLEVRQEINQLTTEMLRSGEWRNATFRPYDVTVPGDPVYSGKDHPLVSIFDQTRRVFVELGFEETESPFVESSFWDFDALFQPQDHPARDMQDTFYIKRPNTCRLPDGDLVDNIGRVHENGGDTGSIGWRYLWDKEQAKKPVLRTHTTAASVRAMASNPKPPRKVFCIGPVFRRETVDYKHLPVFHQVEGIIIDEKATFANLLGVLSVFYKKMGFDRFDFRPAFFPYTEPSVEIFVWSEKKKDWIEMGGAGIFRPEVTEPLGCTTPVLAWGLGLERLAMFRYELANITHLYRARINWLKETPLCR